MTRVVTKRSIAFVVMATVWIAIVYGVMFGSFSRARADEGKGCPAADGNCYWTYCHKNYDGVGNVLSETCNGNKFQVGAPACSEKDCASSENLIE